jgi:hypothetical protein
VAVADPAAEYQSRLGLRRATHAHLTGVDARMAYARLAAFLLGAAILALAAFSDVSAWWAVVPAAAFVVLVQRHDRILRAREAAARAVAFYERGLARLEDRWAGTGEPGDRFRDEHHPFANDLDLFGPASLFELLSLARTRAGEETLAGWLKAPAVPAEIAARQAAISELTLELDLREALSNAGTDVRAGIQGDALVAWAESAPTLSPPWMRWVAAFMTATVIGTIVLAAATGATTPLFVTLAIQSIVSWAYIRRIEHALGAADGPARDLDILSHLLEQLEGRHFASPRLAALREALASRGRPGSKAIHALHRLVEMHDWQHNLFFFVLSLPFLWGTHVAWGIEAWRRANGHRIRGWLGAVGEFEALASLAAYRYEHPQDPYPILVADGGGGRAAVLFEGIDLGHPLLPAAQMVRNDVRLAEGTQLLVVSGSNMSGKSTLLRTAGVNAVLALAGAPVRAASLRLSPLAIGATLRIQDSLQEGKSRFYAEITRIRELADLASGPVPLLFLLDELLHGTNSHDRLVGASGILRGLLDRGAIGLVTTHDLALTAIAGDLAPRAVNVHFEDWFDHGEMRFDYRMKPGPVTRSNAIALMRAVGLDVTESDA